MMKKPLVLMILDGYGSNASSYGNAIAAAHTPRLDKLFASYPHTLISASGLDVGLPDGQMGNSEVGHTNIGAGRIVYQELTRISKEIRDGDFFENAVLQAAMDRCTNTDYALHLIGLLSDGGVHSHIEHLFALIDMAKKRGVQKVFVHAILDGRDTPPESGKKYMEQLCEKLAQDQIGTVATVSGRYYAMDRDNRWDRVQKAYDAYVTGAGEQAENPVQAIQNSYDAGVTDEFVLPTICAPRALIQENDSVIFFNFRPDRAREITRTLVDPDFSGFERASFFPLHYVCFTEYDATMPNVQVVFSAQELSHTFGEHLGENDLKQLRIAETEKYAHVTFFFNGGNETEYAGEERCLINSPKVATYDLMPEMSAYLVCEEVVRRIKSGQYDVIILNYANCDMVGHTGVFEAAVKAVEAVDDCVGKTVDAIVKAGGICLLTADHGNAEKMLEEDGTPFTAHTTNPVPFLVIGAGEVSLRPNGRLADIAPTLLGLLNLSVPSEMDGKSLIVL